MFQKVKKEEGFSLVELLVVIAIIGVLAAAGVIGYNKYLSGAKDSTHANNAATLAQALKTTAIARNGNLAASSLSPACSLNNASGTALTSDVSSILPCAQDLASDFKSPYDNSTGSGYVSGTGICSDNNKGKITLDSTNVYACDNSANTVGSTKYKESSDQF